MSRFIDINFSIAKNSNWFFNDFTNLLMEAAALNTYVETINSTILPNADTLHRRIKSGDLEKIHNNFLLLNRNLLKKLRKKRTILIIDTTYEPFYGSTKDEWIHEYRPVNGCNGCYKFLTASILCGKQRLFVDAVPLSLFSIVENELDKILKQVKKKLKIEVILLDRGFYSCEIMRVIKQNKLKYLILGKKCRKIDKLIKETKICRRLRYKIYEGKSREFETPMIIVRDKYDWVFVTNYNKIDLFRYIRIYKLRWNIETGFRVCDEARIKTKSLNILVRYFLFIVSVVLYNIWKVLDIDIQFKRMLFLILINSVHSNLLKFYEPINWFIGCTE